MLTCQEVTELVTDYLEGRMSFVERLRFRAHVTMCPPCRRYLSQMQLTVDSLGELPEEEISAEAMDELMNAFRSWRS